MRANQDSEFLVGFSFGTDSNSGTLSVFDGRISLFEISIEGFTGSSPLFSSSSGGRSDRDLAALRTFFISSSVSKL